jgi:hypothetical protein
MMKELLNGGVWTKTSQLINDKYGKKIEFRFLAVLDSEQPFYSKGDDLIVPLKSRKHYLGDVVIQRGAAMSVDEKMELTDLIQFLIEPQVYNLHLKNIEKSIESSATEKLTEIKPYDQSNGNVFSIFGKSESHECMLDEETTQIDITEKKKTISNILHLNSKNLDSRKKVALQIHEISGSDIFVQLQDIAKSLHSVSDLKNLAGATIYIEDILKLSSGEIQIISDFSQNQQQIDLQFIIGSDLTDKEIMSLPCHDQLKKDLIGCVFEIDRIPSHQQPNGLIFTEILELLFFSFDEHIS